MHFLPFSSRVWAIGVLLGGLALVGELQAQGPARYFPPAGPTLPRELNYFRRDVGVLDQYNQFVFPQFQLNYQIGQLAAQQRANQQNTQRQINDLRNVRPSEAAPTGVGAVFMNYGHYYNLHRPGAARAR
jgi:hypothetical protein